MDHAWEPSLIPPCNRNAYNNDEEQNLEVELRNGAINGTSSIVDDEQQNTAGQEHSRIGQKFLFSLSSISISTEEMQCLNMEEKVDEESTKELVEEGSQECHETVPPVVVSEIRTSNSQNHAGEKPETQWRGFFRKLRKGSPMSFHHNIPSFTSIKKISRKKSRKNSDHNIIPTLNPDLDTQLSHCFESSWKNFSLADIKLATNNFSPDNLIGEGGYSEVYRGHLEDGELVAIKRLNRGTTEEMTADYLSELGILVHVNHPNIAHVIGYGVEGGMHLVLPLSPHGSLASLLNGGDKEKLTWTFRYNISLGTASGLAYLHEGCQRRIIHRDIKAANVLLTEDFEAQISDFGLAKWLPDQWTHLTVTQFEGTFGYLPPEFFMHGTVDEKTDVYAFGVLLLELITGRPAIDSEHRSLVMWAKPFLLTKNLTELVDEALGGTYNVEEMNRMIMVTSLCIQQTPTERPQMSQVLRMLKGDEGITTNTKRKFQKRPALKRTVLLELHTIEESVNDNSTQQKVMVEQ